MNERAGTDAILAARDEAEAAIDRGLTAAEIFASVGCVWPDACEAARSSAAAIVELSREEATSDPASEGIGMAERERIEETWLNGLLVGLFLVGPASRINVDGAAFASALGESDRDSVTLPTRLRQLGVDPAAAEEAAASVGVTSHRRHENTDAVLDVEWSIALAGAWLDGLMIAVRARAL